MANGIADRFVGDAVLGLFIPGMAGPGHTDAALDRGPRGCPRKPGDTLWPSVSA
jgi:hypothetical protein